MRKIGCVLIIILYLSQLIYSQEKVITFHDNIHAELAKLIGTLSVENQFNNTSNKIILAIVADHSVIGDDPYSNITERNTDRLNVIDEQISSMENELYTFFGDRKEFNIVERSKLDLLLEEIELSLTELFDKKSTSDIGNMLGATHIVAISTKIKHSGYQTNAETTEVTKNVKLIEIVSGRILSTDLLSFTIANDNSRKGKYNLRKIIYDPNIGWIYQ